MMKLPPPGAATADIPCTVPSGGVDNAALTQVPTTSEDRVLPVLLAYNTVRLAVPRRVAAIAPWLASKLAYHDLPMREVKTAQNRYATPGDPAAGMCYGAGPQACAPATQAADCWDGNVRTADECLQAQGSGPWICHNTKRCGQAFLKANGLCQGCVTAADCDDHDTATKDECLTGGFCRNRKTCATAIDCPASYECYQGTCRRFCGQGGSCDDGKASTVDTCVSSYCRNVVECAPGRACDDGRSKTRDWCVTDDKCAYEQQCVHTDCNSGAGPCSECAVQPARCAGDWCLPRVWCSTPTSCNDYDPTTEDQCVDGLCRNLTRVWPFEARATSGGPVCRFETAAGLNAIEMSDDLQCLKAEQGSTAFSSFDSSSGLVACAVGTMSGASACDENQVPSTADKNLGEQVCPLARQMHEFGYLEPQRGRLYTELEAPGLPSQCAYQGGGTVPGGSKCEAFKPTNTVPNDRAVCRPAHTLCKEAP